ncbi:MAG: LysM peptidoglycan-binding domain-containing protein [Desulfobacterales bacterium]|nr:LysM peptidoglycan-binding domain-containing protein [Desulfobacterales bacterium]
MDIKAKLLYATALTLLVLFLSTAAATAKAREVSSETGVYYTVKKGDTLWGLSQQFSDDPFTWPALWSENDQLKNPHLIYPGQKLKLIRRSDIDRYGIDGKPDEMEKEDTPESASQKVASKEPTKKYYYSKIDQVGFMTSEKVKAHGQVFKLQGENQIMLGSGDTLYIKATNDTPLVIGAQYTSYRIIPKKVTRGRFIGLSRAELKHINDKISTQYLLTGVIEIQAQEGAYFMAKVIRSFRDIRLHDEIVPYKERSRYIPIRKGLVSVEGEIIISESGETTFGQNMTGFINRGIRDGIQAGQIYSVYFTEKKESDKLFGGKDLSVPIKVGKFIVLDPREETSTILPIHSSQELKPGYKFRVAE